MILTGAPSCCFGKDRVVEQRPHRDLATHQRIRHRRARGIKNGMRRGLLGPIVLAEHLALEHDAGPGGAAGFGEHLAVDLVVFGFGQVHPALRRIFHQLGIVGDRPRHGGARPELWRDQRARVVVGGIRRRVVLEQVDERQHQRAIGMIDDVGDQLAGRGLGLDAGDELAARRADHLDLDLGKTLVEFLDHLLLDLGEIRRVEHQLAFGFRRGDQLGRAEIFSLRPRRRTVQRDAEPDNADHGGEFGGSSRNDCPVHSRSSPDFIYPVRVTLVCAAPRDSQFAPPMRTPSRTVCTMLKAAVLPRLPPS